MRANKDKPSKLELCQLFKKRKELMWGLNDGSELEESPCHRRILSRTLKRMPTVQEQTGLTKTDEDPPLRSLEAGSTIGFHSRTSCSHGKKQEKIGYESVKRANYSFSGEPRITLYEDEDTECSSDEEYYALEAGNNTQASPSPKHLIYRKRTIGQAVQLYRSTHDEMSPATRNERRMSRMGMAQERGGLQRVSQHQAPVSSRRYSHHPAGPQSFSPLATQTSPSGYLHRPTGPPGISVRKGIPNSRRYSHHPAESQSGSLHQGHLQQESRQGSSPHKVQARGVYLHEPSVPQGSLPGQFRATGRVYSHQLTDTPDRFRHDAHPNSTGYPQNQVQHRREKRTSSQTTRVFICMQQCIEHSEMGPSPQRKMERNNRESTPPTLQHFKRSLVPTVSPHQMNTIQENQSSPLLSVRRAGRQEVCKERNERGRRRIGVCRETDNTRQDRIFVRVLGKRF